MQRNSTMLHRRFSAVKRDFFPRWDRENQWRVSARSKRRVDGHCDVERRVIEIVALLDDPDEMDTLIIHEICHAVASEGHGMKWQRRMERAARRAEEIGRLRLAELVRKEVADYRGAARPLEAAYSDVQNMIIDNPDLTFAQVERLIADEYGLLIPEVRRKLGRLKKVFLEAKRAVMPATASKKTGRSRSVPRDRPARRRRRSNVGQSSRQRSAFLPSPQSQQRVYRRPWSGRKAMSGPGCGQMAMAWNQNPNISRESRGFASASSDSTRSSNGYVFRTEIKNTREGLARECEGDMIK